MTLFSQVLVLYVAPLEVPSHILVSGVSLMKPYLFYVDKNLHIKFPSLSFLPLSSSIDLSLATAWQRPPDITGADWYRATCHQISFIWRIDTRCSLFSHFSHLLSGFILLPASLSLPHIFISCAHFESAFLSLYRIHFFSFCYYLLLALCTITFLSRFSSAYLSAIWSNLRLRPTVAACFEPFQEI